MASDTVVAIDVSSTELVAPATTEDIDIPVPSPLGNAALDSDRGDETRIQRYHVPVLPPFFLLLCALCPVFTDSCGFGDPSFVEQVRESVCLRCDW